MRLGLGLAQSPVLRTEGGGSDPVFATRTTRLEYRETGVGPWVTAEGFARLVPLPPRHGVTRVVHTVTITGLEADTQYEFRVPNYETPCVYGTFSDDPTSTFTVHWHTFAPMPAGDYTAAFKAEVRHFRTLPATLGSSESLRIAQVSDTHGGGVDNSATFASLAARGARLIVHSGDMGNDDGGTHVSLAGTWHDLCDSLSQHAVTPAGEIIPILAAIGNHEILGGSSGRQWTSATVGIKPNFETGERGDAELYYCFFPAYPGLRGFNLLDLGNYATVFTLDPGISTLLDDPTDSQVDWLANELAARPHVPNKLISMHYSPFPSGRRAQTGYFRGVRTILGPVMHAGGVRLALVGHDHVLSRTVPINEWGELAHQEVHSADPDGIVFVGAGTSTFSVRSGRNPATKWWLEDSVPSEWRRYDFEESPNTVPADEYRPSHPADGTTFPVEEGQHHWEIDLRNDGRTVRAVNGLGDVWTEFSQAADPAPT